MAESFYVDITKALNINCALNEGVELKDNVTNIICTSNTGGSTTVFSVVDGVYTITSTGIGGGAHADGAKIIIRKSVDTTGLINNDGCYTVINGNVSADAISVVEPIVACTSVSAVVDFDEFVTFILHPTKPTGRMLVYIEAEAACATFDVSFEPGDFWASKEEKGCPEYQESGVASGKHLIQLETAKFLKDVSKKVAVDGTATNDVETRGCILMRVFPGTSTDPILANELNVACIMID